jgi:hypothetical protein
MSYSVYYAYDKAQRLMTQFTDSGAPTLEAHYFSYNQRDMVTQVQDAKATGADANRYFTYNGVGERVVVVDGAGPQYWTYDGKKLLTEKDTSGTVRRYRHNRSALDQRGSALEISDGANLYYPSFDQASNITRLQSPLLSTGEQLTSVLYFSVFATRLASAFSPATNERLQALTAGGVARLTAASQELYAGRLGLLLLPSPALFTSAIAGPFLIRALLTDIGGIGHWLDEVFQKTRVALTQAGLLSLSPPDVTDEYDDTDDYCDPVAIYAFDKGMSWVNFGVSATGERGPGHDLGVHAGVFNVYDEATGRNVKLMYFNYRFAVVTEVDGNPSLCEYSQALGRTYKDAAHNDIVPPDPKGTADGAQNSELKNHTKGNNYVGYGPPPFGKVWTDPPGITVDPTKPVLGQLSAGIYDVTWDVGIDVEGTDFGCTAEWSAAAQVDGTITPAAITSPKGLPGWDGLPGGFKKFTCP